jgi:hypothetical protein
MSRDSLSAACASSFAWHRHNPRRYLFVLSHMRSYSSLLAHLLGSSPEIDGYGETHVQYRGRLDLWRLHRRVQRSTGAPLRGRWLLDKILQNNIMPPDGVIPSDRMLTVIALRSPENTLRSIVTLLRGREQTPQVPAPSPELACDYYVSRLHRLRIDGERLGKRSLYFDAEALVHRPQRTLAMLSEWLELRSPLAPDYKILPRTGEFGFGDPSRNIYSGRILSSAATTVSAEMSLPKSILLEAQAAYERCRGSLLRHCHVVRDGLWSEDLERPKRTLIHKTFAEDPSFVRRRSS